VNINLTLIVQMFVFALLIYGTMKWIWPPILAAMDERSRKIAQGLAAADKARFRFLQVSTDEVYGSLDPPLEADEALPCIAVPAEPLVLDA